jgi:hypothetical protein
MTDFSGIDPSTLKQMITSLDNDRTHLRDRASYYKGQFAQQRLDTQPFDELLGICGWLDDESPKLKRRENLASAMDASAGPGTHMVQIPEPVTETSAQAQADGKKLAQQFNANNNVDSKAGDQYHALAQELLAHEDDPDFCSAFYANLTPSETRAMSIQGTEPMACGADRSEGGQRAKTARKGAAVAVAATLVGLVAVTGCTGKGKPPAPEPGQAALLGTYDGDTAVGRTLAAFPSFGAATDTAGTTYVLNFPALIGLSATGKGTAFRTTESLFDANPPDGLVTMPDGSVLLGHGPTVVRFDPTSGATTVLAGNADRTRPFNAPAPTTATAGNVRFTKAVAPIGVTRAGAVVIVDDRAVWSLSSGKLTRVEQQPVVKGKDTTFINVGNAVASDGTTYLRGAKSTSTTLADVRVVSPQGKVTALSLPASVQGVNSRPADLTVTWLDSDGADGLYVHVVQPSPGNGDYVLHLHHGTATLVVSAKPAANGAKNGTCDIHGPVDATRFPCALPRTLTYHAGQLTLAGEKSYVVRLPVN